MTIHRPLTPSTCPRTQQWRCLWTCRHRGRQRRLPAPFGAGPLLSSYASVPGDPRAAPCNPRSPGSSTGTSNGRWASGAEPIPALNHLTKLALCAYVRTHTGPAAVVRIKGWASIEPGADEAAGNRPLLPLALLAPRLARLEADCTCNCAAWAAGHPEVREVMFRGIKEADIKEVNEDWEKAGLFDTADAWMEAVASFPAARSLECVFGASLCVYRGWGGFVYTRDQSYPAALVAGWARGGGADSDDDNGSDEVDNGGAGVGAVTPTGGGAGGSGCGAVGWSRLSRLVLDVSAAGMPLGLVLRSLAGTPLAGATGLRHLEVTCAPPADDGAAAEELEALGGFARLECCDELCAKEPCLTISFVG